MIGFFRSFVSVLFCVCVLVFSAPFSFAQNEASNHAERAVRIAETIEEKNLIIEDDWIEISLNDENLSSDERLTLLRESFLESVWTVDQAELINIARKNEISAFKEGTLRDQRVAELYSEFARGFNLDEPDIDVIIPRINDFTMSQDWFVRHQALGLIAGEMGSLIDASAAMDMALEAFNIIPQDTDAYTVEAKVYSLEVLAYLHNLLGNRELALEATENLLSFHQEHDVSINGISLVNNMVYMFSTWRDHRTALELSEVLLRLERKTRITTPGLTEARIAKIHNGLGNFESALHFAQISEKNADHEIVSKLTEIQKIIAMAGLGQVQEAKLRLDSFDSYLQENERYNDTFIDDYLYAKTLLALSSGDNKSVRHLMNDRLDKSTSRLLEEFSQRTTSKLAALQNTQERQAEREASLQREAELKQVALDQEQQSNRLLSALIVALCLGMVGVLCFALYRVKIARRLEVSAKQAEAGEKSKSEFLAMMSHELRTPLNGIIGLSDHLSRDADSADVRMKSDIILSSGNDLLSLVENILDMTLIEGGGIEAFPERTEIGPIIEQATAHWRPLIEDKGVIFTVHIDDTVPAFLDTDPKRFAQCINNLLSNAAKFTSKGRVHMHVTGRELSPGMSELKVIVADTGIGITDDAQSRLFQPFVQADTSMTRQYGGAGLGLAITRSLARMMGGDVTVVSRTGRGSEFTLTVSGAAEAAVPLIEIAPEKTMTEIPLEAEPAPLEGRLSQRRFLVVEDDVNNQDVLKAVLEPMGAKVICAYNGEDALKALKENLFDIILMDVRMPELNGIETTQIIRNSGRAYSDIPIIAITADVASVTYSQAKAAGVDIFLTKPINTGALLDAIEAVERSRDIRAAETA